MNDLLQGEYGTTFIFWILSLFGIKMTLPRYDLNWCKNYAKQHNGECLSPEYLGRTTRLLYRCENGHEFYATPFAHIHKKSWCNECSNRDTAHTLDFVKEFIESKGATLFSTEYKNVRQKLEVKCDRGHVWNPTFQNLYHNNSWCPVCSGTGRRTYGKRIRVKD